MSVASTQEDREGPAAGVFVRPLLVIAGLPRTATTALFENFARHPGFARGLRKELNYLRGARSYSAAQYAALFPDWKPGHVCLDASPYYSLDPDVPTRLRALAPEARVVLLLREPVEWLLSLHAQLISTMPYAPPTFADFARGDIADHIEGMPRRPFSGDLYARIVAAFEEEFGDRLLMIDYASLKTDFLGTLKEIEMFARTPVWFNAQNSDARFYNSSEAAGRSLPIMRYLASRDWVIDFAPRLLPGWFIHAMRARLYLAPRATVAEVYASADDRALARSVMQDSIAFYNSLFASGPFRRGQSRRDGQ